MSVSLDHSDWPQLPVGGCELFNGMVGENEHDNRRGVSIDLKVTCGPLRTTCKWALIFSF